MSEPLEVGDLVRIGRTSHLGAVVRGLDKDGRYWVNCAQCPAALSLLPEDVTLIERGGAGALTFRGLS